MLIWMYSRLSVFFWYQLAYSVMLQHAWKKPLGKFTHKGKHNIQIDGREIGYYFVGTIDLPNDRDR